LVREDELVAANSLDALGENVARILGPALGGALLAAVGLTAVALIDVGSYLIGAALIFLIRAPAPTSVASQIAEPDRSIRTELVAIWREWIDGLRLVSQHRPLSLTFLAFGVAWMGDSILGVLLIVFVQSTVGAGAREFGWILAARGVGGVLGGFVVARVGPRIQPRSLMAYGMVGSGILLLIMFQFPILPVVLAVAVLLGLPVMAWLIAGQTWLQVHAEDQYRGRVFGAFETYSSIMGLMGIAFATLVGESVGVLFSLYIASLLYISAGLLAFFLLRPRFLKEGTAEEQDLTSAE
jgi:predicted MFS family arabinose efflux permease